MKQRHLIYRHSGLVRLTHWINVVCLAFLLMSGLQIFNAHPALYLGKQSDFQNPIFAIGTGQLGDRDVGVTTILGHSFDTTGVLGLSQAGGEEAERAFPAWITLPSDQDLAIGRRWHFFFAWLFVLNGLVYLVGGFLGRHFWRDLVPSRAGVAQIGKSFLDHLRLRFPRGEEARHYNVIQQFAYLGTIFILLPVMVVAGWTMSPGLDTFFQPLLDLFGGRQSARTIHFIIALLLVLFTLVHVIMVLVSGVINNLRSMITGRYDVGVERPAHVE
jgi:thiosulfate reductase cytochrome b subunit